MVLQVSSLKVWRREKFQCPNCIAVTSIHKSQRGNSVTPPENKQEGMGNSLLLACQDGPRGHCKTHLRRALSRKKKTNRPCTYRARQCPHGEGKLAIVKLRLVLNCMFIFTFSGVGAVLFITSIFGFAGARNGCCLSIVS